MSFMKTPLIPMKALYRGGFFKPPPDEIELVIRVAVEEVLLRTDDYDAALAWLLRIRQMMTAN